MHADRGEGEKYIYVYLRYTIDVTMTRWWQVCGVVEVAECETKVEVVPGLQCRPAMERVCTQIQQVRMFRPNKKYL